MADAHDKGTPSRTRKPSTGGSDEATKPTTPPSPLRIVEALLFVGGPPLTADRVCEIIRGFSREQFDDAIRVLNQTYRLQGRPYRIQTRDQGVALELTPKFNPILERLFGSLKEARLSTGAIDVLALVAYRQPATKEEIDSIRGADSRAILRQLVRRGLIEVLYRAEAEQKEVRYGTTDKFLQLFGLQGLEDLPKTQDLQKI